MATFLNFPVELHLLKRVKFTLSQTTLSKKERILNMMDAFHIKKTTHYKIVGLVDDVLTTGLTENFCATILRENGYDTVNAISLATTQAF